MSNWTRQFEYQVLARAKELYGDTLPQAASSRIEEELQYAAASGADAVMLAVSDAFRATGLDAGDVSVRGALGNSYLAYLFGVNGGINPLPPHYRCANCKHSEFDVPENVRVGVELPNKICPVCENPMIGEGFDLEPWFFYGAPPNHSLDFNYNIPSEKMETVMAALQKAEGISGVEQTGNMKIRFSQSASLHLLTTSMTNHLSKLAALTGIRPGKIPLHNSSNTLPVIETLRQGGSFVGVHALMDRYAEKVLVHFKINEFYDIARLFAVCYGTGVWLWNGKRLLKNGIIQQNELPACREDVFAYLKKAGFDRNTAFMYANRIRKGKGISKEQTEELRSHGVPMWFIGYCNRLRYLFPMAHSISSAIMVWRLLYYKLCVDQEKFYQAYFETTEELNEEFFFSIAKGENEVIATLESSMRGFPPNGWTQEVEYALMVALEMMEKGFAIRKYFRDALEKT